MNRFEIILNAELTLIVYMLCGWLLKKYRLVSSTAEKDLMQLVQWITLPCLIIHSMSRELTMEQILQARGILIASAGIIAASYLIGWIAFHREPDRGIRAVLQFGVLSSNCGGTGLSLMESIMGSTGLLYANLYAIPSRIISWSLGVSFFLELPRGQRIKKSLLNPALLAVFIGILLQLWHPPIPDGIWAGVAAMGRCSNPVSMLTAGIILAQTPKETVLGRDVIKLACIRLAVIPLLALFVLRLLNTDPAITTTAVLLSGNPSAITSVVVAGQYGGDYALASKCVFITTIFSIATIIALYMII